MSESRTSWEPEPEPKPKSRVALWVFVGIGVVTLGVLGIGCLATLIVPNLLQQVNQAFRDKAEADVEAIGAAVYAFQEVHGRWPATIEELVTADDDGFVALDSDGVPLDPWGNPYRLRPSTGNEPPPVFSYGADDQPGGVGLDADIPNRE